MRIVVDESGFASLSLDDAIWQSAFGVIVWRYINIHRSVIMGRR